MSVFIKAVFGHVSIDGAFLQEGSIGEFADSQYSPAVKLLEEAGKVKVSTDRNELLRDKTQGIVKSAEESLASLNPPLDKNEKELPTIKTMDFATSSPILKKADDTIVDEVVVDKIITKSSKSPLE